MSCSVVKNKLYKPFYYSEKVDYEFCAETSLRLINGVFLIEASVEGVRKTFLVDTGSRSYISKDVRDILYLQNDGFINSKDVSGSSVKMEQVKARLSIDALEIPSFKFTVKDSFEAICNIEIDGILGNNILNQGLFFFDRENLMLRICSSSDMFNSLSDYEKLHTKIDIGNVMIKYRNKNYTLDSGYSNGFVFSEDSKNNNNLDSKDINHFMTSLHSPFEMRLEHKNCEVSIGDYKWNGVEVISKEIQMNLFGSLWFQNNNIIIDVNGKRLYIMPLDVWSNYDINDVQNINFKYYNGKIIVSSLSCKITSLKIGQEVLEINDFDLGSVKSQCDLNETLSGLDWLNGAVIKVNDSVIKTICLSRNQLYEI
jgi:hypothetical protein